MATGIDLRGKDQVLQQFDLFDTPFFAVYQGKDLKFYHDVDNIDEAKELLSQNLDVLEFNASTAPFKIVYYTQLNNAGKLTQDNTKGSATFRVCSPGVAPNNPNYGELSMVGSYQRKRENEMIELLQQKIDEQNEKIALLIEAQEAEKEEPETVSGVQGVIGALMANPVLQEAIIGRLLNLVDKILPAPGGQSNTAAIAGVTDESDVQSAIRTLFDAGMTIADLQKLADLSKSNPALFKMLLGQLRNQ